MYKQLLPKISFSLLIVMLLLSASPVVPVQAATKTAIQSGNWNDKDTWEDSSVPGPTDDVTINSNVTVTVPSAYSASCNTINFTTGTTGPSSIVLADNNSSLTVSGAVTIQEQASGGSGNQINVDTGTFSAASVDLLATTNASRYSQILISTGTATISGNITSSGTASRITFSGAGRLYAGGSFLSGTAGTFTPFTSTVDFNANGAQTVGAYTFNNLILSGSDLKSMPAGASVSGNLNISGSAKASVAAGQNLSVGTLTLDGLGTDNGTWGSTSSSATYKADNFFNSTTGYLTVAKDTRTPQNPLEVTGPDSLTYGTTGKITYTGGSVNEDISYSSGSSTGCTIDASGVITVTNASGSCTVTATRAENGNYLATKSAGFDVTLNPRPVTLTGNRAYDTTTVAAAGILSITNKTGTDDVAVAYGNATLAGANVGTQSITSMGTLALYGAAAGNYTLSGATGSVTIVKANQAPLTVTGPASVTYGTTGTITYIGGAGTGAMSYSHGTSSTGCTVNSSTGLIMVTNVRGSCTVTATKAADMNYLATTSEGRPVTLNRLAVTLYGNRAYDTTNVAAAGILSIRNRVGADGVTISGSAALASTNVGTQSIISMGGLTLGGNAAANYTLSGASGSVAIAKANQTITFVVPVSPPTYLSTFQVIPSSDSLLPVTVTSSGACSISGNTVSMTSGTGPCTLTASQAGDANYKTATNVVKTVNAQKASQTITFAAPASPATYNSTFTVSPTSSSRLDVTVMASGGCTISGNTVSMTSGTNACTLTASQADAYGNYTSAPNVVQTVTAQKADQVITFAVPVSTVTYNSTFTVSPTSSSGLPVTVKAEGACSISGGTVTMDSGTDTCKLTASQVGDTNYNSAPNEVRTVSKQKTDQRITFPAPASTAKFNSTFTVSPTSDSGLPVTVKAEGACSISGSNVTMTSGMGNCTLTASQAGDSNYALAINNNIVQTVTAKKADQAITFTQPASPAPYNSEFTVYPTSSSSLAVTVKAEGACSISSNKVTMNSGTDPCKLTAYQVGNNNYNRATDVVRTVAAQKASQTVTFNQPASPATYNSTFTVYPTSNSGLPVTVTSSGACSINGNTVSMTSGTGPCTLTASQAGDANYKPATTVVKTVNAQKASQTITFAAPASPATYNSKFTVYPTSSSGLTVTVTASGGCAISGNTVSMTSGTYACTLTASRASDSNYNSANNMVRTVTAQKANQSITFNKPASPATYNSKFTLYPTSSSGLAVTVTASGGCNISGNTVTMTSGTNSCNLQASRAGDANYNPATNVEQTVTAQKASQTITFNKPASPATYNSPPFTVSPTSNSNLPVNVNASGACTISGKTVTMTNGTGDCTLTASQDGDEKYNPATNVVRTVSAQKAVQAPLTVTGPSSITFGATGTVIYKGGSGSGRVLFNHGSSTGCIVDAFTGVITVTNASGSCTVWVTKESDNNYLATSSAGFEIPMKRLPAP